MHPSSLVIGRGAAYLVCCIEDCFLLIVCRNTSILTVEAQ